MDGAKFEIGTRRRQMLRSDVNEGNAKTSRRVPRLSWDSLWKDKRARAAADFGPRDLSHMFPLGPLRSGVRVGLKYRLHDRTSIDPSA